MYLETTLAGLYLLWKYFEYKSNILTALGEAFDIEDISKIQFILVFTRGSFKLKTTFYVANFIDVNCKGILMVKLQQNFLFSTKKLIVC